MDNISSFIRNFKLSQVGLSIETALILYCVILLILIGSNLIVKYWPTRINKKATGIVTALVILVSYTFAVFLIIQSILNQNYWNLILAAVILISSRIQKLGNKYDKLVDKSVDKVSGS